MTGVRCDAPVDARHSRTSLNVGHPAFYRRRIGFIHDAQPTMAAAYFLCLFGQIVAMLCVAAAQFPAAGNRKAPFGAALGFELRHFYFFLYIFIARPAS